MQHAVYIEDFERPTSKAALRRAVVEDAASVLIEDAEHFGLAEPRPATDLTEGETVEVAGPEPSIGEIAWRAVLARWNGRIVVR